MIDGIVRGDRTTCRKPSGFRNNVGVKGGVLNLTASRPKTHAAHFVRIGFAGNGIGAGACRRATTRKARSGKIEAAPKEVHRAGLANETPAKFLQDRVDACEHSPETMRVIG